MHHDHTLPLNSHHGRIQTTMIMSCTTQALNLLQGMDRTSKPCNWYICVLVLGSRTLGFIWIGWFTTNKGGLASFHAQT